MAYRQTNNLSVADVAYAAGLIDGEGSIRLLRQHRTEWLLSLANRGIIGRFPPRL